MSVLIHIITEIIVGGFQVFLIGFLIYARRQSLSFTLIQKYFVSIIFLISGMLASNILLIISKLDNINPQLVIYEEIVLPLALVAYFSGFYLSHQLVIREIIRVPPNRLKVFNRGLRLLNGVQFLIITVVVILLLNSSPAQSLIISFDVQEYLFTVFVLLSVLVIIYFWRLYIEEQQRNQSKLTQARLEYIISSIRYHFFFFMSILTSLVILVASPNEAGVWVELVAWPVFNLLFLRALFKHLGFIDLSDEIRQKFDLTSSRFLTIKRLNQE